MAATLTAYNDALRDIWTQDFLEEQLFKGTPTLDQIEKTKRHRVGKNALVPLHVSRNGGYTVFPQGGGTLNAAGNQGIDQATYNYTHHHQQIAIQGDALDGTSDNSLSVADALDTEVNGALTDLRRQIQRQVFQNGDALLSKCGTTTAAALIVLDPTEGKNAIDRGWVFVGLPVDIGTAGSESSLIDGETITAVGTGLTAAACTVTVTTAVTTSGSNWVSVKNSRSGATSYEMNGLRNLVSATADFGGLTVAGQPVWKAANVDTTSQALTLSLMMQQNQRIHQATSEKADWVITGLKQERKFYELLQTQVRFSSDQSIGAGKVDGPSYNGMSLTVDPDCQDEDMFFGQKKHLFIVATDKPKWQNAVTGGDVLAWIQGTDSYGAKLGYRIQLATNRRNGFARLGGLS